MEKKFVGYETKQIGNPIGFCSTTITPIFEDNDEDKEKDNTK